MTAEPDPWDECAACGHDREDHDRAGCTGVGPGAIGTFRACPCIGFVEEGP